MIKKSLQLTTEPLDFLLKNKESIDFRLDEPAWKDLNVGDIIEFWEDFSGWDKSPSSNSRKALVTISNIFRASSFSDLINNLPDIFTRHTDKQILLQELRKWWTPEREKETGVVGFLVKLNP